MLNRENYDFRRDNDDVHREHKDFHREHDEFHGKKMVAVIGKLGLLGAFLWIVLIFSFHWFYIPMCIPKISHEIRMFSAETCKTIDQYHELSMRTGYINQ